jgi:hypothetical protein
LRPLEARVADLSISSDLFHSDERFSLQARLATEAARHLDLPVDTIAIVAPDEPDAADPTGQLPLGSSKVQYRGRAAEQLAPIAPSRPWDDLTECRGEDLHDPGRVHIDPLGLVHVCQGITIGNVFSTPLAAIWAQFRPDEHPITGPLLAGGPAELVRHHRVPIEGHFADGCHLCYETRRKLRSRFPDILAPDQVYGVLESGRS